MGNLCKIVIGILLLLWLLALFLYGAGTWGWFGQERDPLAGVFLVLLAFPWTHLVDLLPETMWPAATALAPGLTILILWGVCRSIRRPA